jgi:pimeloyl-ACP methyl ester carboxylesterase
VRSLVLIEPGAYWVLELLGRSDPETERLVAFLRGLAGTEVSEDDLASFLQLAGFVASPQDARRHPDWERWVPHRMALSWSFEALARPDRAIDELANLHCRVLLVKGAQSAAWLRRVVDALGELLPNATILELPGDHACHIQSIDAFLEALERHLGAAADVSGIGPAKQSR